MKQKVISKLNDFGLNEISELCVNFQDDGTVHDILYNANITVFQSSSIGHKERLSLLKELNKICKNNKEHFCLAHNLTLMIKVSKELGLNKNLTKDSHKAIELWKKVLDRPLAINGLIFSYVDLGLIFSDYNLNSLALKYLDKADSLLTECENEYFPYVKLHVAYAVIHNRMKNYKKAYNFYNLVGKKAELKNDDMTLIPILNNIGDNFLENGNLKKAENRFKKALKICIEKDEKIYRPYIYNSLGKTFLKKKRYNEAYKYFKNAYDSFNEMNSFKMVADVRFRMGNLFFVQKKYEEAEKYFMESLNQNKKLKEYDLDIKILKKLSEIYKINENKALHLKTIEKLNYFFERNIKKKDSFFSDINSNALKHLSDEISLSLRNDRELSKRLDLETKKRKLTSSALRTVSEKEFLKKIIISLNLQKSNNKKIIDLCQDRINSMRDWNVFMKLFNDIHPKFNKYIINKCSDITESELRICNLIKMNFSTSEIAEILSVSIRGVEQHRYRIKKKLNLKSDLTIFIQSL